MKAAILAKPAAPLPYVPPPARGSIDVVSLLHWAIGHQKAHKAAGAAGIFDPDRWVEVGSTDSITMVESVGRLGTFIDQPAPWAPRAAYSVHEDAAKVYDQVRACLTDWRLYRLVMVHAELGTMPDWRKDARLRCEPCDRDKLGRAKETKDKVEYALLHWCRRRRVKGRGVVEDFATGGRPVGDGWRRYKWEHVTLYDVRHTPIRWIDPPDEVYAARLEYARWWRALADIAGALTVDAGKPTGLERWTRVSHRLPEAPWPAGEMEALGRAAAEKTRVRRELVHLDEPHPSRFDLSAIATD